MFKPVLKLKPPLPGGLNREPSNCDQHLPDNYTCEASIYKLMKHAFIDIMFVLPWHLMASNTVPQSRVKRYRSFDFFKDLHGRSSYLFSIRQAVCDSPASDTLWFSVGAIFTFNTFPLILTILEADRWHADRACQTHPTVATSTGR